MPTAPTGGVATSTGITPKINPKQLLILFGKEELLDKFKITDLYLMGRLITKCYPFVVVYRRIKVNKK